MGKDQTSQEHRCTHSLQVVYTRKMERRRIYMEELKDERKQNDKQKLRAMKDSIGPIWYQVLSVPQRNALDTLELGIYQDLIEGTSRRTSKIIRALGIYPQPDKIHLINSVYAGCNDPKEMIAHLFLQYYGHYVHVKRSTYDLNGRLFLSAILYLGLEDLIRLLEERFRPDIEVVPPPKLRRIKEPPLDSPYLQKMVAVHYEPKKLKRQPPLPLPNLDEIDDPYEPEPMIPKPPPPPPPPPLPKKRLPRSLCDKVSGMPKWQPTMNEIGLQSSLPVHTRTRKRQPKLLSPPEGKKTFGIDTGLRKKSSARRKRPPIPSTALWNAQYVIQGVYNINERCVFILDTVSILPPLGDLIHGGFALVQGTYVNIHCGFTARPEPKRPPPCECLNKYQETVFHYVKQTRKCNCGHNYDFGNEGTFPPEEVPFFEKPTRTLPFRFNYETIYELDPKIIHLEKEFRRVWENDSNLNVDSAALAEKREKEKKKIKRKKASNTCLGSTADYLKCALKMMREGNLAARLPDIQLVPELKEWMRRRLFGPFTATQKQKLLRRSVNNWNFLKVIKGMGHIVPPQDPTYLQVTTWAHKQALAVRFRKYVHDYQLGMYKLHAKLNNIMWATMCQAEFPDKKFREIFFSYLVSRMSDLQLMHPYSSREAADRRLMMALNRYSCPPEEILDIE